MAQNNEDMNLCNMILMNHQNILLNSQIAANGGRKSQVSQQSQNQNALK